MNALLSTPDAPLEHHEIMDEDTNDDMCEIAEDERRLDTVAALLESVTSTLAAGDLDAATGALADAVATLDAIGDGLKLGTGLLVAYRALLAAHRARLDDSLDALAQGQPAPTA